MREFIPMTHDNFFQNCFQTLHHTGKTFVHLYKLLSMSVRLIFIVIEKTSLYLAFLWSRLFCIFFASLNFICLGEKNRQFLKETGANNSEETPSKQNKGCGVEVISPL